MSQSTPTRRANYTREEFNIEVVSMHGETASAVLTPEYGNEWSCKANVGGMYRNGRGSYPWSAFNYATAGAITGAGTFIATASDIDGEDHTGHGTTPGAAVQAAYTRMVEARGLAQMGRKG
jgi:hypothetical protein